jgi:hypothetical protein
MHPQFLVWCLTFGAQFKNDGHYFCRAGGNRPDGLNEPVTCIVHMARNSLRFMSWKDYKAVTRDLKAIYQAPTEEAGQQALEAFAAA